MNIVIYARYSSSGQREESIEGQLKACYDYASLKNFTVIGEYIDRASTATNDHRTQFQKMLSDSDKKHFQGVLVYQLDRFARNRYDSALNKRRLKNNGVRVFSAKENISDDPAGIMLEGMLETMAEYISADMAQKIKRGHHTNAEKCVYNGGPVPLGYTIDENKHYQIDENTAAIVRKVFDDYAHDKPIVDIVEELRAYRVKTYRGTDFTVNSFRTMLKNQRYTGRYIYDGIEISDGIPRIISDELFNLVQDKITRNKKSPSSREKYLLTTKLFCGHCEDMMVGISGTSHTGKLHSYYSCNNRRSKKCDKKNVQKEKLEDIVVDECRRRLTPESIAKIAKEVSALCEQELNSPFILQLRKEIASCESAIKNLTRALEQGAEVDIIISRIKERRTEKEDLEAQLAKEELNKTVFSESDIISFLNQLRDGNENSFKYRQGLINTLVNRIYLYDDKITIIFNSGDKPVTIGAELLSEIKASSGSYIDDCGVPNLS